MNSDRLDELIEEAQHGVDRMGDDGTAVQVTIYNVCGLLLSGLKVVAIGLEEAIRDRTG